MAIFKGIFSSSASSTRVNTPLYSSVHLLCLIKSLSSPMVKTSRLTWCKTKFLQVLYSKDLIQRIVRIASVVGRKWFVRLFESIEVKTVPILGVENSPHICCPIFPIIFFPFLRSPRSLTMQSLQSPARLRDYSDKNIENTGKCTKVSLFPLYIAERVFLHCSSTHRRQSLSIILFSHLSTG